MKKVNACIFNDVSSRNTLMMAKYMLTVPHQIYDKVHHTCCLSMPSTCVFFILSRISISYENEVIILLYPELLSKQGCKSFIRVSVIFLPIAFLFPLNYVDYS
jgi:hypothetical protein